MDWRTIIRVALNSLAKDEEKMNEVDTSKCFDLTNRAFRTEEVEYNVEELGFIMGRIKKIWVSPLIAGRAEELFNKEIKQEAE